MELWDIFIDIVVLGIGISAIKDGIQFLKGKK